MMSTRSFKLILCALVLSLAAGCGWMSKMGSKVGGMFKSAPPAEAKEAASPAVVSGGDSSHHLGDGSGTRVASGSGECVNLGHSVATGHPGECAGVATAAAPQPAETPPPPAAPEPVAQPVPAPEPVAAAPTPAPEIERGEVVKAAPALAEFTLNADALFAYRKSDAASMNAAGRRKLDEIAAKIADINTAISRIDIVGHADRLGPSDANQTLSERRAETVKQYLAQKGVDANLISAEGRGEEDPVVHCKGEKRTAKLINCLAPNRRVDVVIRGAK